MNKIFIHLYGAAIQKLHVLETQGLVALSQLALSVDSQALRELIENHHAETKGQVHRLKGILRRLIQSGATPELEPSRGKPVSFEWPHFSLVFEAGDSALIGYLRSAELREIDQYASAFSFANLLNRRADAESLARSLSEETRMAELLEKLDRSISLESVPVRQQSLRPSQNDTMDFPPASSFGFQQIVLRNGNLAGIYRAR